MIRSFIALFFLPVIASAQAVPLPPATYNLIAPIGNLSGAVTLQDYVMRVFSTAIGIAGILAVVMIVICGIRLMGTGSVSGKSEAKECIWNAIFGVLIAIGSWMLLNTINPLLLKNDTQLTVLPAEAPAGATAPAAGTANDPAPTLGGNFEPGYYFRYKDADGNIKNSPRFDNADSCIAVQDQQEKNAAGSIVQKCFPIEKTPPPSSSGETATRQSLCGDDYCITKSNSNVFINKIACDPYGGNYKTCNTGRGGTNVGGLPSNTVSFIKTLPGVCSCVVTVTGGTEAGHTSHGPNLPIFDLGKPAPLVNYIKSVGTGPNPSFCYKGGATCFSKWLYGGYWFTDEGNHWHVCQDGTTYSGPEVDKVATIKAACNKSP